MTDRDFMDVTFDRKPLTGNYTQISNELVKDAIKKRLSMDSLSLMTVLYSLYPEDERLTSFNDWMDMLGMGINRVKKAISKLVSLGYIHIKKNRDQWGRFTHNSYQFYRSPSDNPYFGKQSETELETPENGVSSMTQNPCYGDGEIYLLYPNTFSCYSLSVYSEMGKTEMQTENVETVEMPVENSESLTDCITASIDEIITENAKLKEKLSLIPDMHEFMKNLTDIIKTALLRLKHPEAKGTFIKNTIIHILEKVKAKKQEPTPKPEKSVKKVDKPTPLTDTLALIGSQLVEKSFIDEEDPDCESIEYFYNFPLHIMQEDIQNCTLPYSLQGDKKAMRDAIQYVTCYSYDRYEHGYKEAKEDISFRYFMGAVVDSLTEIITTERVGKRVVHYYEYIDKINQIIRISGNLYGFVVDFEYYFRRLLEAKAAEGEPVRNQKRYLNVVLSDFLISYNANQIIPT